MVVALDTSAEDERYDVFVFHGDYGPAYQEAQNFYVMRMMTAKDKNSVNLYRIGEWFEKTVNQEKAPHSAGNDG
jgi:hypothetical protein